MDCINDNWNYISSKCTLPKTEFLIRLVLDSTYFIFNKTMYKQNYGTSMGSPLLPIIADLIMQKLEKQL